MQWYPWHCTLKSNPTVRCERCTGLARPVEGRPMTEVTVGRENFDVVPTFCYAGDCLSSGGRLKARFYHKMSCHMKQIQRAPVHPYHACETWAPTLSALHRLQLYVAYNAVLWWMCDVTAKHQISSQDIMERLQLEDDLEKVLVDVIISVSIKYTIN